MATLNAILMLPAIIILILVNQTAQDQPFTTQSHQANLKLSQLESNLKEIIQTVKDKEIYSQKQDEQIQEMEKTIKELQSTLSSLKICEKVNVLEEEVRALWAASRKNNFDNYVLQSKVREAEDRLEIVASKVKQMADIVSEQWIQIQQFEQALLLREMTILKARRQSRTTRCSFLEFMNDLCSRYLPEPVLLFFSQSFENLRSYIPQLLDQLRSFYSTMKASHHKLQGYVKQEMERLEFTAHLANEEIVFFVASALIIFPVCTAWMLLSSS